MITIIQEQGLVVGVEQDARYPLLKVAEVVEYTKQAKCEGCGAWIPMGGVCIVDERVFCKACAKLQKRHAAVTGNTPRHP